MSTFVPPYVRPGEPYSLYLCYSWFFSSTFGKLLYTNLLVKK
jgi:hypothetical protein